MSAKIYNSGSYSYTILSSITKDNVTTNVTSVGDEAFLDASQLTAVTIPDTVTTIGARAFEGTGLTSITLPEDVASVGTNALNTNSLATVTIENEDAVITGIASAGIPTAATINVPGAVYSGYQTTLGAGYTIQAAAAPVYSQGLAYGFNSSTQSYTVTGIGNCTDTNIVIPSTHNGSYGEHNVTEIMASAFAGRISLTSITIPNSVTSIGNEAFRGCSGLTSITIPNSVTNLGGYAFCSCTELTSVLIGNGVTSIGDQTFYDCSSLTSVTIPDSVTSIGTDAFDYCDGLASITIGSGVTEIASGAFSCCWNLKTLIINSTSISEWSYSNSYLLLYAETIYVLDDQNLGSYLINAGFNTTSSDKDGYVKYVGQWNWYGYDGA